MILYVVRDPASSRLDPRRKLSKGPEGSHRWPSINDGSPLLTKTGWGWLGEGQ